MESLLKTYRDSTIDEPLEIEIRYKDIQLETVSNLLTYMMKNHIVEHQTFIDALNYNQDKKIGLRTFLKNGKKDSIEPVFKDSIDKVLDTNPICDYSLNLSIEKVIDIKEVPKNPTNILLKHRYSYSLPMHKNWRVDITITRKAELTAEGIKKAVKEFFVDITTVEQLFDELRKKRYNYMYNMEIEYTGKQDHDIKVSDIKSISTLPFKIVDENVESKLYYVQELDYVRRTINSKIQDDHRKITREPTALKGLLPSVKTITRQQYNDIFPPLNWLLTDKRDGLRTMIIVHDGYISMLTDPMKIVREPINCNKNIIIEGETVVDHEGRHIIVIFDALLVDNVNVTTEGIEKRITYIPKCVSILNKFLDGRLKEATYFSLGNQQRYKSQFEDMFKVDKGYEIDGLIMVKKEQNYMSTEANKWKPVENQTIDFYCKRCPDELLDKKYYLKKDKHTLYLLFVGGSINMITNLQLPYVDGYKMLFQIPYNQFYRPIAFSTPIVPLAYLYYHPDSEGIEDLDNKILELSCASECIEFKRNQYTVNWKLHKIRHDKAVVVGKEYGNNYMTAFYSFMNHIDPFPLEHLYQGSSGSDQYFKNVGAENNAYGAMRGMMSYIKAQLISQYAHKANRVLDLASGRGADLRRYIQLNSIGTVVVSDNDKAAITELFGRWLDISRKSRTVINSSLRGVIMNINDPAEGNIARVRSVVDSSSFNTIFCHHALHYFLESLDSIHNLAKLCSELTLPGSHIVFTCPFGESIFEKIGKGEAWTCIESDIVKYKFERLYKENQLEASGQKVKVLLPFSKGELYEEYLVNTESVEQIFSEYKMKLIDKKNMDKYFDAFSIHQKTVFDRLTDCDKQHISMYGILVFKRV